METIVSAARTQLAALDVKRDKLLKIIELAESLEEITDPVASKGQERAPKVRQPSPVTVRTHEAVRSLLEERGAPVRLRDLLSEMRRRDIPVGGKNEIATLAARLSNADEFRSVRGVGWWFADRPVPDALPKLEEPEGVSLARSPSGSNTAKGGSENAAALVD